MLKHLGARRRLVMFGLVVVVAAAATTAAWAAGVVGGTDPPARFFVELNGVTVPATSYSINGTTSTIKGVAHQSYKVVIDAPVTDDTALVQAFQTGQSVSVQIELFDAAAVPLTRYSFSNATVASYQQTGTQAGSFEQELVLTSSSLTVS